MRNLVPWEDVHGRIRLHAVVSETRKHVVVLVKCVRDDAYNGLTSWSHAEAFPCAPNTWTRDEKKQALRAFATMVACKLGKEFKMRSGK